MKLKVLEENERIDKYLKEKTEYSRELITKMINEGYILVNNKEIKPSYKVKINDEITLNEDYIKPNTLVASDIKLDIVYEDDDLMVINKPSGLVVHPGAGNHDNTLVNGLLNYTQNLSHNDEARPGIVHRLDKDTSGLMIVAKSNQAHVLLAEGFKNKSIIREYVALVDGVIPVNKAFIDAPIARDKNDFMKMKVTKDGKEARTHLTVLKRYAKYTLIRLKLETGRTHQIRVHLAYIGYPLYNDPVYNKKASTPFGQFLHSEYLKFTHPITGKVLEFTSPLPEEFQSFLDILDKEEI